MKTSQEIIENTKNNVDVRKYNLLELQLYLVIKQILAMYFNNQISKEEANKLKQKAVKEYESNKKQFEFEHNMWKQHIENIKNTENLRIRLRKQLNSNTELKEIINTCLELIQLYSGEEFI